MATTITKVVDPDNGSGTDYTSLAAWEAGMQKNLVTADEISVAKCRCTSGTADTASVLIDGWTTDSTRYIKVWTDTSESYRHSGKWTTGNKYRLEVTKAADGSYALETLESYTKIYGLQVKITNTTGSTFGIEAISYLHAGTEVAYNIVVCGPGAGTWDNLWGIYCPYSNGTCKIYNNIVYDFRSPGGNGFGISMAYAEVAGSKVYCNTVYNCGTGGALTGVFTGTNYTYFKNNIANDSGTDYGGTFDSNSGRNVGNVSLSQGANGATQKTGTTTGAATNKLIDSGGGLSTILVGSIVKDSTTNYAYVTAVDSDTQLSISSNIYSAAEAYTIYQNQYGSVTFVDEANDDFHLSSSDTVAKNKGYNLYTDVTDDIDGNPRPTSPTNFDIGADQLVAAVTAMRNRFQEYGQERGQHWGQNY